MQRSEWLSLIEELLEVGKGVLKPDVKLAALQAWDSVNVIGFIALVDEHAHKVLEPERIMACTTVGDLIDLAVE